MYYTFFLIITLNYYDLSILLTTPHIVKYINFD